ncbi:camphor resistance protein CrcB [Ferrimonas balearica DSM 9799]|uniref:Fluoride-specific ion channel FluC n=1 Tax=Ferrimonas balearica (strain DSM 9799 / CCM 4581 / KCTC 23876 / PAT) TaxID=550540 RepID=E1STR4_FERBD|nr:fluoride efflux transporter CrcB [Ferrimonas balearica]ADN76177.1 camphor resistance protein CrcB [Ferrimonas balearica DSM 9799]MBW3139086.1 fluoride efflux transporter CrcB [Ferrimonas balearica]MBW3163322.1 fluoride efflux transporter CrcB [Ferrimonas balearica]MBY5981018.1 fluoride efflux transporter CrcB [Ferrimonas balearica]
MHNWLAVALGGAIGASLRYGTSILALRLFGTAFPYGTLAVNCVGSFAMGALYAYGASAELSPHWKALIGVGLLGALTTFSTFSNETLLLMQEGAWLKAALNISLNLVLCLLMVFLGQQWIYSYAK